MRASYQQLKLSNNYAQLLLDRQIQVKLALQPLHKNICSLLQLYSQGFQYYQSIGCYKYKYFQIRMKEIFDLQQKQFSPIQSPSYKQLTPCNQLYKEQTQLAIKNSVTEKQRYRKQVESNIQCQTSIESIQKMLLKGEEKLLEVNMRMKHEIDFQYRLLERKLQNRSSRSSVNLGSNKKILKYAETKTSLVSQSSKAKDFVDGQKTNIFDESIMQNEEELQGSSLQTVWNVKSAK